MVEGDSHNWQMSVLSSESCDLKFLRQEKQTGVRVFKKKQSESALPENSLGLRLCWNCISYSIKKGKNRTPKTKLEIMTYQEIENTNFYLHLNYSFEKIEYYIVLTYLILTSSTCSECTTIFAYKLKFFIRWKKYNNISFVQQVIYLGQAKMYAECGRVARYYHRPMKME